MRRDLVSLLSTASALPWDADLGTCEKSEDPAFEDVTDDEGRVTRIFRVSAAPGGEPDEGGEVGTGIYVVYGKDIDLDKELGDVTTWGLRAFERPYLVIVQPEWVTPLAGDGVRRSVWEAFKFRRSKLTKKDILRLAAEQAEVQDSNPQRAADIAALLEAEHVDAAHRSWSGTVAVNSRRWAYDCPFRVVEWDLTVGVPIFLGGPTRPLPLQREKLLLDIGRRHALQSEVPPTDDTRFEPDAEDWSLRAWYAGPGPTFTGGWRRCRAQQACYLRPDGTDPIPCDWDQA